MPTEPNTSLEELLAAAAAASPSDRITLRDPIAAFGADAIVALEPWLSDQRLSGFAVRAIGRAAVSDQSLAIRVLRTAYNATADTRVRGDIGDELRRLGAPPRSRQAKSGRKKVSEASRTWDDSDLTVGEYYTRAELQERYGGTIYRGISYPADADYIQVFSDPSKTDETGYRDRWVGPDEYWYAGQWDGLGDMELRSMNLRMLERSPNLHLFIAEDGGHRYEGRFNCDSHHPESSMNQGVPATAIVFELHRVVDTEAE